MFDRITRHLEEFDRDESGAVLLLCMASFLIILMLFLVVWDSVEATSEKIHVQTATDAAAFSEASVRARTMNMIAFSNVGKRMTVGMLTSYININQWLQALKDYSYAITAICALASGGALAGVCAQVAAGVARVFHSEARDRRKIYRKTNRKCAIEKWGCSWSGCGYSCWVRWPKFVEYAAPDYGGFGDLVDAIISAGGNLPIRLPGPLRQLMNGSLNLGVVKIHNLPDDIYTWRPRTLTGNFFGRELQAFDNYQRYMSALSPFWSWTEGVMRGLRNHAPVTVSYPTPTSQPHRSELPIEKADWREICKRAHDKDRKRIFADVILKTLGEVLGGDFRSVGSIASGAGRYGSVVLAAFFSSFVNSIPSPIDAMTPRTHKETCEDVTGKLLRRASSYDSSVSFGGWSFNFGNRTSNFKKFGRPYLLKRYRNEHEWLLATSNLTFGFRPNASKMDDDESRQKYGIVKYEYNSSLPKAGGTWTLSRGEMAFHGGGNPSMWKPQWTARLRPVALPGEWRGFNNNFDLATGFRDISDEIGRVTVSAHILDAAGVDMITHPYRVGGGSNFLGTFQNEARAISRSVIGLDNDAMEGVSK